MNLQRLSATRTVRTWAVVLLLGCCAGSAAAADPKASRLYEDALIRYERKDMAGAVVQLKNALQIDRSLLPVHVLLGKALLASGDVAGADVALTEALRLGVNRAEVVTPLAKAMIGQGKQQALLEDPRFAMTGLAAGVRQPLLLALASAHADLGKPRDALRLIEESRAIDPNAPDSWLAEVPVRIRARQFAEAAAAADRAQQLLPRSADAVYLRGSVAHTQGDLPRAMAAYGQALQLQPTHLEALLARAGIALDLNDLASAKRDVEQARASAPNEPRALYLRAVMADREGDAKTAKAALAEITQIIDPVPVAFLRYQQQSLILNGLAHHGLGAPEKAKPYFEMIQRDQPGSPVAKLLGQIYLAEGNVDRALQALEGYLRAFPTDAQALAMLASAHMSQGRHARAAQVMADALKVQDKPKLRTLLGLSLIQGGKLADATAELEAAYARDPNQTSAGAALVGLYLQAQQTRKALAVAEGLVKRQPQNASMHHLLGSARAQAGELQRARASLEQAAALDATFVEPQLALARLDARARQYDAALARLDAVLARDEKNVAAWIEKGTLLEQRGQTPQATLALTKAADHAGNSSTQAAFALFEHHLRGQRLDAAQEAAKRLAAMAGEDVMVLLAQARLALAMKSPEAARGHLVKASRAANFDPELQVRVALLQGAAGDPKGAAYSLSKALQAEPNNLTAQALMADAELQQGELDAAGSRAQALVAAHPRKGIGHALLGDVAAARGQWPQAQQAYRRSHELEPGPASVLRLHRALAMTEPAAAQDLLLQWIRSHPQDLPARRALADGYARAGQWPAAKAAYEQQIKAGGSTPDTLNNYAHVLLALRDGAGALRAANQALERAPDVPHIIGTAGWVAYKVGQTDRGLQLLRDARLRDPANADTRYYLAAVLAATGRISEAREELRSALRGGTAFASAKDAQELLQALR